MAKWIKSSYDEKKMEEIILRPFQYLKPLRIYGFIATELPKAFNYWLRIPNEKLELIQKMWVKLNVSFAILDDLIDDSLYRRTQPAAHIVFGNAMTINSMIHLQYLQIEDVIKLGHPKCIEVYCKNFLRYTRGSGVATYWRDYQCDVTLEDYYQMTINQTGFIFLLLLDLMQLFSDNKTDYQYLPKIFSIYYQIRDEYVDLKKPEAVEAGTRIAEFKDLSTMTFCDDFTEGKLSAPVIASLKSQRGDLIHSILKMRSRDNKVKQYLLSLLEEAGGMDKTRELLRELEADIFAEIRRLGGNPLFEELMRDLQSSWE